jgi:hypothetical protein
VGEQSSLFGTGYDENIQRLVYEIGEDGHEDDEAIVQGSSEGQLVQYPDATRGVADVSQ